MAVYKVIQDVEAEDKIVGPLTLKGFIYTGGAGLLAFICFRLLVSGLPPLLKIVFIIVFLPPMLLLGTLASPLGREQPTEVWLLSRIRFLLKPRERTWDQNGTKQLVTITAPKKPERVLTKNLSQSEVSSRLQALANTLDSRGWAVKNVAVNLDAEPSYLDETADDDRLTSATIAPGPEVEIDVHPADDMLDEQNNAAAQNMATLVQQKEDERQLALADQINAAKLQAERQAKAEAKAGKSESLTPEEKELLDQLHERDREFKKHSRIIRGGASPTAMTSSAQTVKLELSNAGNDLSVASIAHLANRGASGLPGEVTIPL